MQHITVFEGGVLRTDKTIDGQSISRSLLKSFERFYEDKGSLYYSFVYNGVKFKEYVGVIQIGNTLIEVLPKADCKSIGGSDKAIWRNVLIDMLRSVGSFEIKTPTSSFLRTKPNSILEVYIQLFISEVESLLHRGLLKKYRTDEGNCNALKGSLMFSQHLRHNLVRQERFFVRYTTYDKEHLFHQIIYKTLLLLKDINFRATLFNDLNKLLFLFPEMPDLRISASTFDKIAYNRKSEVYKKAIDIARLLLLNYHPDICKGKNNVLALMFNMNALWEQFVYCSLKRAKNGSVKIFAQSPKAFWQASDGNPSQIIPDIIIEKPTGERIVLDTKWKNLNGANPSPEDLRQMFVYHEYFNAKRVALVYPGLTSGKIAGKYFHPVSGSFSDKECSVVTLAVNPNVKEWQREIYQLIDDFLLAPAPNNASLPSRKL